VTLLAQPPARQFALDDPVHLESERAVVTGFVGLAGEQGGAVDEDGAWRVDGAEHLGHGLATVGDPLGVHYSIIRSRKPDSGACRQLDPIRYSVAVRPV
jgi:hypothetical protein